MPNVKITTSDGQTIETDLSFAEIKELISANAHNGHRAVRKQAQGLDLRRSLANSEQPDYAGFKKALTDKARKFFQLLHDFPVGITSEHLAEQLGFKTGSQIGGMTGGGITKIATRFGVDVKTLYKTQVKFGSAGRVVTYHPGPNINMVS